MRFLKFLLICIIAFLAVSLGFVFRYFRESINLASANLSAVLETQAQILSQSPVFVPQIADQTYSLFFVGDIMLARKVDYYLEEFQDFRYPFLKIGEFLSSADFTFGNLEGPISSRGKDQGSKYSFRANPKVIQGLKYAGFDAVSVANNHIWDWGSDALSDTLKILEENGIKPVGAGKNYAYANNPVIFALDDLKIALLAYTNLYPKSFAATVNSVGISLFDLDAIKKAIKGARSKTDLIVVSLHWGDEYQSRSNKNQVELAHALIDAGADFIVGHHPHVIQEVERYKNGWIIYSLGNFIFDQHFSEETKRGLIAKLNVKNKKISGLELIEIKISDTSQPELIDS